MFNFKSILKSPKTTLILLILINIFTIGVSTSATAEKIEQNNDSGLPTHRRDGGSRGICNSDISSCNLVALIPEEASSINASTSPKLFFYVPKIEPGYELEFVLRNERDELVYEAFLTTEGEGIMSVDIPENLQANTTTGDRNYHWYLSLINEPQNRSRDVVVEGWIRQSEIDGVTKQKLNDVNSIEQAELYQEKGFWFDALAVLADKQQSEIVKPTVQNKWSELLTSIGLEDMASKPFIESELIKSSIK